MSPKFGDMDSLCHAMTAGGVPVLVVKRCVAVRVPSSVTSATNLPRQPHTTNIVCKTLSDMALGFRTGKQDFRWSLWSQKVVQERLLPIRTPLSPSTESWWNQTASYTHTHTNRAIERERERDRDTECD